MQVKSTVTVPEIGTAEYARLRELVTAPLMRMPVAVALAASDLPERCYLLFDDAVRYAIQGMARIGVEAAEVTTAEVQRVALADIALMDAGAVYSDPARRALRREEKALWGGISVRRRDWCTDLAYTLCLSVGCPAWQAGDPRFVSSAPATGVRAELELVA